MIRTPAGYVSYSIHFRRKEKEYSMKKVNKKVIIIVAAVLIVCWCFTHRRVIRALVRHEPMPKAPKWHFWCRDRKS